MAGQGWGPVGIVKEFGFHLIVGSWDHCGECGLADLLGNGGGVKEKGRELRNLSVNLVLSNRAQRTSTGDPRRGRQGYGIDGRVSEAGDSRGGPQSGGFELQRSP